MAEASAPRQPPLGKHLWPAFGKPRVPGDILFWPRDDQRVLGIPIKFTHWAVYVGRRKLAPCCTRWEVDVCETTGEVIPESVVHLWGAADSATRDTSADAVVVHNRLDELGGVPYDGNLEYDERHTPRRPEQILRRVLVSLGTTKLYETRFGKYHVVGNNCEHFATWSRYGVNRSDQIGDAVKYIGAGFGAFIGLGAPGVFIGGYAADAFVRSTHASRRNEIFEKESSLFENTDGCEFADDDKEVDWVVECLVRSVEDREKREEDERAAHASGRAHLPRGVPYASDSSAAHSADAVFVDGVALHADAPESAGALLERLAALNGARGAEAAAASRAAAEPGSREPREVFSVDSAGNLGGVFGEGLRAFGEGLRGAMRDGEATPTAAAARGEGRGEGEGGEGERREDERRESRRESSRNENEKETPSTTSRDGRRKDPDEQLKDVVSGVGNLLGGMLGGVLKLGGALASEVASQHENHRRRVEARTDARSRGARGDAPSSNPGPDGERSGLDRPRRGAMVIEELE